MAERRPLVVTSDVPAPAEEPAGSGVAELLLEAYLDPRAAEMQHIGSYELPSDGQVERVVEMGRALLFPGYAGPEVDLAGRSESGPLHPGLAGRSESGPLHPGLAGRSESGPLHPGRVERGALRSLVEVRIGELRAALHRQVYRALHHRRQQLLGKNDLECAECTRNADSITERFIKRLPELRALIRLDLRAAFESDPAATGIDEILLTYPGAYAVTVYRMAHALREEGALIVPRMMTELAHRRTGIDIHPGAEIGHSFFIDHGTGVVIGETTLIGDRVRIYQGVTLGALTVPQGEARPEAGKRRHPTIEDDAVIYANATILGGDTVVGKGAVIGGNAFITSSVAPGTKISGSSRTQK